MNNDLFVQGTSHALDRRRSRNRAYYICTCCNNQFLFNRKKERACPICYSDTLNFVQTVDEFTEKMMDSYSNNTIVKEYALDFKQKCDSFRNWFVTNIFNVYAREKAERLIDNIMMRKESC